MVEETLKQQAVEAVERLWAQGCPMASPESRDRMVEIGIRRWRSFHRRNRRKRWTRDDRLMDVAKGLDDAFSRPESRRGADLYDYLCVAEAIAGVIDPVTDSSTRVLPQ